MTLEEIDNLATLELGGDTHLSYLQYLVKVMNPAQVVEFGADVGLSAAMMALYLKGHLYSVDVNPNAWEYLANHSKITKVVGDDNDLSIWKDVDANLALTDLWYIDSWHDDEHVFKTLAVYGPYFKKGAIIVFDDLSTIPKVWDTLPYEKRNITFHHYPGFGICQV